MRLLVSLCMWMCCSAAFAASPSDADSLLGVVSKIENSLPLDVKKVNAITGLPARNWSAAQVRSADNASGPLLRVEGGLDEKAQLTSLSLIASGKASINPDNLKSKFGKWTGQREKPIASSANPKPLVYFYERPWGDLDFEFNDSSRPALLRTVTIVPYKREKASGLSRRSKLSTPAK